MIHIDTVGDAHILFTDSSSNFPRYATNTPGSWVAFDIETTPGDVQPGSTLKMDGSGFLHAAYYRPGSGQLVYATNATGVWVGEVVPDANSSPPESPYGEYASLALDADGYPRIAYYGFITSEYFGNLRYAYFNGTDWTVEVPDTTSYTGKYASLALDTDDHPHIAYYDESDQGRLLYVVNAAGTWSAPAAIDESASSALGKFASMRIDADDYAHVCYWDETAVALKYATNASGAWVSRTIDSSGGAGQYGSLAIGTDGAIHISYYSQNGNDLKYATNSSGEWTTQVVDAPGTPATNAGTFTSIAIGPDGRPHISYIDATNTDLKYAVMD